MKISHASHPLIRMTDCGLFCEEGNFYIDPVRGPVQHAVITHGHSDHARGVSNFYYATSMSEPILRKRLGCDIDLTLTDYGDTITLGTTKVSFHPAGHILGSAQIRVEANGEVWVVTGDFKRDHDPTCAPFEVVPCDTLISEATFALPIYRWKPARDVALEILRWWEKNISEQQVSVLFCYALGKAQRVLAELASLTDRSVLLHGAVVPITEIYREAGVQMLPTSKVDLQTKHDYSGEMIIAPPSAAGSLWMRRFKRAQTGFCSGWMRVRGQRRRRGYDRGFVLSDHADWPSLLQTLSESQARHIQLHHGYSDILVRYLCEQGVHAEGLGAPFAEMESDPE
ncbi:MAG: DNA ligase-associated DEXH box helicase [Nitrospirales bacterium]|nr:MAG: DNA ligase-associated DEXH box helicase [Nitrospirales bacterium]